MCGPFSTASWNGHRYFVSFIDDFSWYDYLYLLHEKSEVLDVFKVFKAEVELQLGNHVKAVRSDCGGEPMADMMDQVNNVQDHSIYI